MNPGLSLRITTTEGGDGALCVAGADRRPVPHPAAPDGFDAMNPEPDYSAAYVVVRADADDGRSEAIPRCRASDGDAARCVPGVRDTRRASGGDH